MDILKLSFNTELINSDLGKAKDNLHYSKPKSELDKKAFNDCKNNLNSAKQQQKELIVKFEGDEARYKSLKKYGEVLKLVEKLLGLIPSSLENLSTEELEEKLEELLKYRKRNEMQVMFIFYQNMITDLLCNLVTIEKDYQLGNISASQALSSVKSSKQQIKEHVNDMPEILRPTLEEASYLVKLYETSYSAEDTESKSMEASPLKQSTFSEKNQMLFTNLNDKTNDLISKVGNLSTSISNFEPQVDLTSISKQLVAAQEMLSTDDWDVKTFDNTVKDLKKNTLDLTDKQVASNKENKKIATEIKDCSKSATELTKTFYKEFSRETFDDITKRTMEDKDVLYEVKASLANDENLNTTIGTQVANTILAQIDADSDFASKVASDPNAAVEVKNDTITDEVANQAMELKSETLTLEEEREMTKLLGQDGELDEEEMKKKLQNKI